MEKASCFMSCDGLYTARSEPNETGRFQAAKALEMACGNGKASRFMSCHGLHTTQTEQNETGRFQATIAH